MSTAHMVFV